MFKEAYIFFKVHVIWFFLKACLLYLLQDLLVVSILFWISGTSGKKSLVRGTWRRETPRTIVPTGSLDNPVSLQYDVTSNR